MTMRASLYSGNRLALLLLTLLALGGCFDSGSGASPGRAPGLERDPAVVEPRSVPELGPLIAGTASYVNGSFVWTDYVYDDHGANSDGRPGGNGAGGYPAGLENHADLVQLQIGLDDDALLIRAILQTLTGPAIPVLGVAFDTDANPNTGAAALPGGSWSPSSSLGIELLLIVREGVAELQQFSDGEWSKLASLEAHIDVDNNLIEARLPLTLVNPNAASWRAFGVLGFTHPQRGSSWPEGDAILDLAFVGDERPFLLQTVKQADILAGLRDPAEAAATIDFALVAAGHTELAQPRRGGFETFLHHSRLESPGGVRQASGLITGLEYLGPYQPYLVWIPDPLPTPAPLHVFLHGASQNHLLDTWVHLDGWPYHGLSPGLIGGYSGNNKPVGTDPADVFMPNDGALGSVLPLPVEFVPYDAPGIMIFPLGRMNSSFYSGIFAMDVLEALADIQQRFAIDPDRISLSGASMGGIGSFRLASLYPDIWSHVFPIIGDGSDFLGLFGNLNNLPIRMHNGLLDPLIAQPGPSDTAQALDDLGYDYRYWLFPTREHESLFEINHCVRDEAFATRRDHNPARVLYTLAPALIDITPETGYSFKAGAYWVSGMEVRSGSENATVDLSNLARADRIKQPENILNLQQNILQPRDVCGPNPAVQTFDSWIEQGIRLQPGPAQATSNGIRGTLTNLERVVVDVGQMGLSTMESFSAEITSNGNTDLLLAGPWPFAVEVLRGDKVLGIVSPDNGKLLLPIIGGTHSYRVRLPKTN